MPDAPKLSLTKLIAGLFEQLPGDFVPRWLRLDNKGTVFVSNVGLPAGTLQSQTKPITDLVTVERLTFDPPIKAATIKVRHTAAADVTADDGVLLCFGAPTVAAAKAWLNETNIAPRIEVMAGQKEDVYFNGGLISHIDMIGIGTAPGVTVTVGGIY